MEHHLKLNEEYYTLVDRGIKNFEVRLGDRDYWIGDTLILHEVDDYGDEVGRSITRTIAYPLKLSVCALLQQLRSKYIGLGDILAEHEDTWAIYSKEALPSFDDVRSIARRAKHGEVE